MSPIGVVLALAAALGWGSAFPAIALCMEVVTPLWVTAIRFGIGLLPMVIACAVLEGGKSFSLEGRGPAIFAIGAVGMGGYNLFAVYGIKLAGPEHAALLFAMVPLITTVVVAFRTRTLPSTTTMACTAVALLGISLVITGGDYRGFIHSASFLGDALLLAGTLCWVIYTIARSAFASFTPLRFTTLTLSAGELVIVVAAVVSSALFHVDVPTVSDLRQTALLFVFLGIAPVIVAIICYNAAIDKLGPDRAALFINAVPIVTFAVQAVAGVHAPPIEYGGAAIVIAALIANNLAGKHAAIAHAHSRVA